jgi:hypothetical protein
MSVSGYVPEFDDTVGGESSRARGERHPDVHRRSATQPEVRLVGHPCRVAVGRGDLPLADQGVGIAKPTGAVHADLRPDAAAQGIPERESESQCPDPVSLRSSSWPSTLEKKKS